MTISKTNEMTERYSAPYVKEIEITTRRVLCQSIPTTTDGMYLEDGGEL